MENTNTVKRISYAELSKGWDMVLNNYIHSLLDDIEIFAGNDCDDDGEYMDIYQEYIIPYSFAEYLKNHTDEIIYYSEKAEMYIWGITHYGTSWNYVYTDFKE